MEPDDSRTDRAEVEAIMQRLAAGDVAALVTLIERFRPQLAASVRRVADARGARLRPTVVDELVTEVALAMMAIAPAWSADGGALPWVWGRHQVAGIVDAHLGQFTVGIEAAELDQVAVAPHGPSSEPAVLDLVAVLARQDPTVALLVDALQQVASVRDQQLFLEMALQSSLGDRAPAKTVGAVHGVRPEAVRQQHRRVRLRVLHLATTDDRYAVLRTLPLVA